MSGPANPKAAVHNVQMPKKLFDFLDKLSGPPKNDIGLIFDMFFSDQIACPKSLQLFGHLVPGTRRAFPEHIRPASRDVSNDARSGNANRHVLVRYLLVQIAYPKSLATFWASGRPIRQPSFKGAFRTPTNKQLRSIIRHSRSGEGVNPP